jgi:alpha-ketoglutarate-dependent taurine dioxygenase
VTKLTSSVGARIEGVDVGRDIDAEVRTRLQQALWEHGVLVLPGADVGMEEQVRVVSCFGPVQPLEIFRFLGEPNPVLAIDPKGGGTVDREGKARRKVVFNRRP